MPDNSPAEGWQLIVTPWHLDEHIPGFPLPAGAAELIRPSLPAGPQTGRMTRLYQAAASSIASWAISSVGRAGAGAGAGGTFCRAHSAAASSSWG